MPDTDGRYVLYERAASGVAVVTLNRPERLNALSVELMDQLADVYEQVEADSAVRCLVITGAGNGFCAGGDFKSMAEADRRLEAPDIAEPGSEVEAWEDQTKVTRRMHARLPQRLYELSKPTLALVNGAVAGAGMGIACCCDLRVASDRASFTTAFARIARSGDFGTSFFLRQLVGPARARELYYTSERIDAAAALGLGLVNYVYPHAEFLQRGLELAERIAAGPPRAFARMKEVFRAADAGDLRRVLELETLYMPLSGRGREGREFLRRFVESRPSPAPAS